MSQRSADNEAPKSGSHRSPASGAHRVSGASPSRGQEQASVQKYLDRYASAMTAGDTKTLVALWGVPAFVIGPTEARVMQSEDEVAELFARAKDMYNARGIVDTRAEILDLDWISDDMVIVKVRWPYLDRDDRILGQETSSYTLLRGENGSFKLRVATMRGASEPDRDE